LSKRVAKHLSRNSRTYKALTSGFEKLYSNKFFFIYIYIYIYIYFKFYLCKKREITKYATSITLLIMVVYILFPKLKKGKGMA